MTEKFIMTQAYRFCLNTEAAVPAALPGQFVAEIAGLIKVSKPVDSDEAYTNFLAGVTGVVKKYASQLTAETPIFQSRLPRIGRHEQTIPTGWGGVFFREASESRNLVEKFLIVKQAVDPSGVLGFEYHKKKVEKLRVEEGYTLLMQAGSAGTVTLTFAGPGDSCKLEPPTAHGIIPLTNTAILETSNYELDADDLLFIFKPVKLQS